MDDLIEELQWAKRTALAALATTDAEFAVGETEQQAASRDYDRMTALFNFLLSWPAVRQTSPES